MSTQTDQASSSAAAPELEATSSGKDSRSVGELLRAADTRSRAILLTVDHTRAAAMARTMPALLEETARLSGALSSTTVDRTGTPTVMERVTSAAIGIRATQQWSGWPPPDGPADPDLDTLIRTLARARQLVTRYAPEMTLVRQAQLDDLAAAQARVLHIAWVSTHAGVVALRSFAERTQMQLRRGGAAAEPGDALAESRASRQLRQARGDINRLDRVEQLLGRVVAAGFSATTALEVHEPPRTTERLDIAVARWDLTVRRALTLTPSAASAVLVGRVNASATTAVTALLHAAAQTGALPDSGFETAAVALDASHTAWSTAAAHWTAIVTPHQQPDRALTAAAEELVSSLRQITQDHAGWADPQLVASRVDLTETAARLTTVLSGLVEHAELLRDLTRAPLTSPARTLLRSRDQLGIAGDLEEGHSPIGEIPTEDLLRNRPRPLPHAVRRALARTGATILDAATAAARAVGGLTATDTPSPATDPASGATTGSMAERVTGPPVSHERAQTATLGATRTPRPTPRI